MPRDYRRVLDRQKQVMASLFEEAADLRRSRGEFELDDLRHKAEPNDFAFVEDMLSKFARPARRSTRSTASSSPRTATDWDWPFTNFVKVLPEGNRRILLAPPAGAAASHRPADSALTLEVNRG